MEKGEGSSLSIVIPAHDAAGHLSAVLSAVMGGMDPGDSLTVVDDRSTDASVEVCRSMGVEPVASDRPPGAAGTRNCGARTADGDWILFVDSDAVPPPGWRDRLREAMQSADAVQAVYASDAPGRSASTFYKNYYYHYTFTRRIRGRFIPGCGTFFFAVRRRLFLDLGGFDEKIAGATVEDADFAARLTAAGGRILLLRDLEIMHLREYDLPGLIRYEWAMAASKTRYALRRGRDHGRMSISMAGVAEMIPFAAAAVLVWLVPAGLVLLAAGWHPGVFVALSGAVGVAGSQGLFWISCVGKAGLRGLRACLVGVADLFVIVPAALSGLAGSLAGRRY